MSGYNVVFSSIFDGSLGGRWPASSVMLFMIALKDRNGLVDMSYQAISSRTGMPMKLLREGIKQLMEPDPDSRCPDEGGRRLVPIDPDRPWGWRVVNHRWYQEKARKNAADAQRTASGANAERMGARQAASRAAPVDPAVGKAGTRADPRSPAQTRADPPSDSDSDSDSDFGIRVGGISGQEPASSARSEGEKPDPEAPATGERPTSGGDTPPRPPVRPAYESPDFHRQVREVYHETLPSLPKAIRWTRKREQLLNARIRERISEGMEDAGTVDYWRRFFRAVAARPFLLGDNDRGWTANLEWLLLPSNYTKIIEGNYTARKSGGAARAH